MKETKVREFMEQAYRTHELIESLQSELSRLQELAERVTAYGGKLQPGGSLLARIVTQEDKLKQRIAAYVDAAGQVHRIIEGIGDADQRTLLHMRYLGFKKWEEIAEGMGFSQVWIFKLHKRGLYAAGKLLDAEAAQLQQGGAV